MGDEAGLVLSDLSPTPRPIASAAMTASMRQYGQYAPSRSFFFSSSSFASAASSLFASGAGADVGTGARTVRPGESIIRLPEVTDTTTGLSTGSKSTFSEEAIWMRPRGREKERESVCVLRVVVLRCEIGWGRGGGCGVGRWWNIGWWPTLTAVALGRLITLTLCSDHLCRTSVGHQQRAESGGVGARYVRRQRSGDADLVADRGGEKRRGYFSRKADTRGERRASL
jgi:hypothetical protein